MRNLEYVLIPSLSQLDFFDPYWCRSDQSAPDGSGIIPGSFRSRTDERPTHAYQGEQTAVRDNVVVVGLSHLARGRAFGRFMAKPPCEERSWLCVLSSQATFRHVNYRDPPRDEGISSRDRSNQ